MPTTQMNVRIDADLKERGDQVFESLGYTPSQVVRRVWEVAAENGQNPTVVDERLMGTSGSPNGLARDMRVASAEYGCTIVSTFLEQRGISPGNIPAVDYRQLREEAVYERLAERGLL
jgi:RHH-type rel operon transcriptional repressor/antitoxin RelB